jgi:hypothetical protein
LPDWAAAGNASKIENKPATVAVLRAVLKGDIVNFPL